MTSFDTVQGTEEFLGEDKLFPSFILLDEGTDLAGVEEWTNNEVLALRKQVLELKDEVSSLRGELRLLKRKFRTLDPNQDEYQEFLERRMLKVLETQSWRISSLIHDKQEWKPSVTRGIGENSNGKLSSRFVAAKQTFKQTSGNEDEMSGDFDGCNIDSDVENSHPKMTESPRQVHAIYEHDLYQGTILKAAGDHLICSDEEDESYGSTDNEKTEPENYELNSLQKLNRSLGKKRDRVWDNFTLHSLDGKRVARCNHCHLDVSPRACRCKVHLQNCSEVTKKEVPEYVVINNGDVSLIVEEEDYDARELVARKRRKRDAFKNPGGTKNSMGRKRDQVWDHFTLVPQNGKVAAYCNYCDEKVSAKACRCKAHLQICKKEKRS